MNFYAGPTKIIFFQAYVRYRTEHLEVMGYRRN